jgi:hypothetical protein
MRAEEAQKRYYDTIETATGKAKLSRERVAIEAQDGAEVCIAWGVNAARTATGGRGLRRPG